MAARTLQPSTDLVFVLTNRRRDCHFGGCSICIRRSGGDIFALQTITKLRIGLAHMTLQRVSSTRFILTEVMAVVRVERYALDGLPGRNRWLVTSGSDAKTDVAKQQHCNNH